MSWKRFILNSEKGDCKFKAPIAISEGIAKNVPKSEQKEILKTLKKDVKKQDGLPPKQEFRNPKNWRGSVIVQDKVKIVTMKWNKYQA